jgi:hypothetical protein
LEFVLSESGPSRNWIGFLAVAVSAFAAGVAIPVFRRQSPPAAKHSPAPVAARVVPDASRFVTTFQGPVRRPQDTRDYWGVAQIGTIEVGDNGLYRFKYVLSLRDETLHGEGTVSAADGTIHMGILTGESRLLPNGAIEIGSRFNEGPPTWRFRSLPPGNDEKDRVR